MKVLKREKDGETLYTISGLTQAERDHLVDGLYNGANHYDDSAQRIEDEPVNPTGANQTRIRNAKLIEKLRDKAVAVRTLAEMLV